MQVEQIIQTDLNANEKGILAADRERWALMGSGSHLHDWMSFGEGQMLRRRLAMRIAHTNQPVGRGYNEAFGALMRHDGFDWSNSSVKTAMTAVLWLHDDPERLTVLRDIQASMTPGQRSRLNSPISARQRVEKELKVRAEKRSESPDQPQPLRDVERATPLAEAPVRRSASWPAWLKDLRGLVLSRPDSQSLADPEVMAEIAKLWPASELKQLRDLADKSVEQVDALMRRQNTRAAAKRRGRVAHKKSSGTD